MTVATRFPDAALWDPTNTPGIWDHTLLAAGKTVLFESKGNEAGSNNVIVDLDQLRDYLALGVAPLVFYLFADPPGWKNARPPVAPGFPASTWPDFDQWAHVVPVATLALATGLVGKTKTVRPQAGAFKVAATGGVVPSVPLGRFFDELEACFWVTPHLGPGSPVVPGRPGPGDSEMLIGDLESLGVRSQLPDRRESGYERLLTAVALHLAA